MVKILRSKKLQKFKPPVSGDNARFWTVLMFVHYIYNIFVIVVGSGLIIVGYKLIDKGVNGEIEWILKVFGTESSLKNASPGVFLIAVGLFIIILARDTVECKGK
jgi:hypothetical protein